MSLQMTQYRSFLWLSNIPLYICTTSSLSIPLSHFLTRAFSLSLLTGRDPLCVQKTAPCLDVLQILLQFNIYYINVFLTLEAQSINHFQEFIL